MSKGGRRPRYRETTYDQRRLLMDEFARIHSVVKACAKAKVGRNTFYRWRPRYEIYGDAGLKMNFRHGSKKPKKVTLEIEKTIVSLKKAHPKWGKQKIANELKKRNNWENVVCAKTVKRVLMKNGLWPIREKKQTQEESSKSR